LNFFFHKNKTGLAYLLTGLCFWLVNFQDKFFSVISTRTYSGWDTHSYGFINFLYFSDALKGGSVPLWNPFIQSGVFFPNFINVGLFYPFELFFVFLGWFINPLLSYELMLQAIIFIGAMGAYLLVCHWNIKGYIAFIGAILYGIIILLPMVGQNGYTFSFSSLPWLILGCSSLCNQQNSISKYVWISWGIGYLFLMVGGYFWLNLMNLLLAFIFVFFKQWSHQIVPGKSYASLLSYFSRAPILFIFLVGALYACIVLPSLLNISFNYSPFFGDFVSPDGRLRGLKTYGALGYGGALQALIGNIDPLISKNQPWWNEGVFNYGAGWALWIILVVSLLAKWSRRQLFWLAGALLAIIYSAGSHTLLGSLVMQIPIVNANRYWLGVGTSYASVFLLFIGLEKLNQIAEGEISQKTLLIRVILTCIMLDIFLLYIYAPLIEYVLVGTSCLFLMIFCQYRLKRLGKIALLLIAALNAFYVLYVPYRPYSNPPLAGSYFDKIANRKQDIVVTENYRKLDSGSEFNYYDTEWLYQKIPFAHGYNHLGNPRYWYIKNSPILNKIVVVTQSARADSGILRGNLKTDNEFAELIGREVLSDPTSPIIPADRFTPIDHSNQFAYEISNLVINPNSVTFELKVNAPAHVILNMLYAPGWNLTVNGQAEESYRANHIFQGIDVTAPGIYFLKYTYRPYAQMLLLSIPYVVAIMLLLAFMGSALLKSKS